MARAFHEYWKHWTLMAATVDLEGYIDICYLEAGEVDHGTGHRTDRYYRLPSAFTARAGGRRLFIWGSINALWTKHAQAGQG